MKTTKLLKKTGMSVLALGIFATSAVTAFAEGETNTGGSKDVPVLYENVIIPDPGNPTTPKWGVTVPSKIAFNDAHKVEDKVDVELVGMNGFTRAQLDAKLKVEVSIQSKGGMLLTDVGDLNNKVTYTLGYGGIMVPTQGGITVATLDPVTEFIKPGVATLTGTAVKMGKYKDTLVYTIKDVTLP